MISCFSAGCCLLDGQVTAVLPNGCFSDPGAPYDANIIFEENSTPICTVRPVHAWIDEYEEKFTHLCWPSQSLDLYITEPFM